MIFPNIERQREYKEERVKAQAELKRHQEIIKEIKKNHGRK